MNNSITAQWTDQVKNNAVMSVPKPLTHNVNDALWHACRLGNEDAVKWALGLEVGEGQLYYAEEFWEVRKLEGYLTKEKGYDRNYSPAFGQTAAHIAQKICSRRLP